MPRKKTSTTRARSRSSRGAEVNPAPAVMPEASGFYVKIPLPPELAAALSGHVERATALVGTIGELFEVAGRCAEAVARERDEIERTRRKLRGSKR